MEEIEVPLEQTQEHLQHASLHKGHGDGHGGGHSTDSNNLINIGAVLSAVLAVFAAICALLAGHYSNEAMIEQIKSSDQWSYYQAKGIKGALQEFRLEVNTNNGEEKIAKIQEKIEKYKKEQEEIQEIAKEKEEASEKLLHWHERLAMSVTFFQVAIAVIAIGVLTRKKFFFYMGTGSGLIGLTSFISFLFIR